MEEKRRATRFSINQSVTVTLLRDPETRIPATVTNASAKGVGLISEQEIPQGTAIKIELSDEYILGESVYCSGQTKGWLIGVELNQVLTGLSELGRRLQEFATLPLGGERLNPVDQRQTQHR